MPAGVTADNAKYYPNTAWQFGDCTLSYFTSASGKDVLGKVQNDIKNDSIKSVIMGFSPDPSSLKTEIANVSNVAQEYGEPLEKGLIDPNDPVKGLAAFQKKLKDAGIDTIIKTYQDQVNAWATQNTK
jgi:putative aldouronate transport system substrate-binding protein